MESQNKVETRNSGRKRCDYIITYNGTKYYVWATKEGPINVRYYNDAYVPDEQQSPILEYLRSQMRDDPHFQSCFE